MSSMPLPRQLAGLVGWLAVTFAAAAVGALASVNAGAFYQQLERPAWAPPAALFGPVWTLLYVLMGIAAWLVWRQAGFRRAGVALTLFLIQLAVNALWTWLFFVWRLGALAFVESLALGALVLLTVLAFWRIRLVAGMLLLPYLAWVTYAAALTLTVWQRNPTMLG